MKRYTTSLVLLLLLASPLWSQQVRLPAEVKGEPGAWIVVVPESKDGGEVKFKVGPGLTLVPIDKLFPGQKPAGVVVQGKAGTYEVWAWNAKGDVASDLAVCKVIIGDMPPGPGPGPGPDPKPPDPPTPGPSPISGKRCLIIYETADATKIPPAQQEIIFGRQVRDYLNSVCETGPDGKTKEWRIWDKDVATDGAGKVWQDAMKRDRKSVPWLVVGGKGGGYEGPLPGTVEEFLALVKKHLD